MPLVIQRRFARVLAVCGVIASVACGDSPSQPSPPPSGPPTLTCPAPITVVSTQATLVGFATPTVTGGALPLGAITCSPGSGTLFPQGITPVLCSVADAQGRSGVCNFSVTVQRPPTITFTRFMAWGDSITRGENGNPSIRAIIVPLQAYPYVLQGKLAARYLTQTPQVVNVGESAERLGVFETFARFSSNVGPPHQAVLIMEGSNDVNGLFLEDCRCPNSLDLAAYNLDRMVALARLRGVRPYVATIPPMNPTPAPGVNHRGIGWSRVNEWNDRVRAIAAAQQATLVDVHVAFNNDLTLLSPDGLHPNERGFERIADTFFQALRDTLEVPQ